MITNDLTGLAGVPSEAELTKIANDLFGDIEGSIFEPEVCAEDIDKLVRTGVSDRFPGASDLSSQREYKPSVISRSQADREQKDYIQVRTTHEDSNIILEKDKYTQGINTVGGQKNNSSIVIGTKTLEQIRQDFPILRETVNGHPLIWLDNGATTQRPKVVIDRLSYYYEHENSNVHRGAHTLAARSTDAFEGARQIVADFIGAPSKDNIVFVRGTTEGINLVAQSYVKPILKPGDEIIVSLLEHHANIVP